MKSRLFILTLLLFCLSLTTNTFGQDKGKLIKSIDVLAKRFDSINNSYKENEDIIKEQFNLLILEQKIELDKVKQELEAKKSEAEQLYAEVTEQKSYNGTQDVFVGVVIVLCFVSLGGIFGLITTLRDKKRINKSLEETNELVRKHVNELKIKNNEIIDSIRYAKKIQDALLLSQNEIRDIAPESFVYFRPKDIISGDFYWFAKKDDLIFVATADCTGHGVPGSLMSMLGISYLEKIIMEKGMVNTADILNELKKQIIFAMNKSEDKDSMKDGMDMSLYCLDTKNNKLNYSAANNGIYIMRGSEIIKLDPEKQPVGPNPREHLPFNQFQFSLMPNDFIITYSDGFADQFGGVNGKKFKYKQLQQLLIQLQGKPTKNIPGLLNGVFEKWKGKLDQVDDVLIIGLKV